MQITIVSIHPEALCMAKLLTFDEGKTEKGGFSGTERASEMNDGKTDCDRSV